MSTTVAQIVSTVKSAIAQTGQFTLTASTIDSLPLQNLFSLLEISQLQFDRVVNESENSIDIIGKSSLLGVDSVEIEVSFEQSGDLPSLGLSVKVMPAFAIPGAANLILEAGQIALHVTGAAEEVSGLFQGNLRAGQATMAAVFEVVKQTDGPVLRWSIAEMDVVTLATVFLDGAALPAEMPVFRFTDIKAMIAPQTGAFDLEVTASEALAFPANGGNLTTGQAHLQLDRRDRTSPMHCAIALASDIGKDIVEGLHIAGFNLDFEYQGGDWSVGGAVQAVVLDAAVTLAAAYQQSAEGKTFKLSAEVEMAAVSLGDIGHLSLSGIELEFTQPAPAESASVPAAAPALAWSVSAAGAIAIPGAVESEGTLSIFKHADTAGLEFKPKQATVTIPLPPDDNAELELEFAGISLIRQGEGAVKAWQFTAAVDLAFRKFHPSVQPHLPKKVAMTFVANHQGATLAVVDDIAEIEYAIPDVALSGGDRLELGTAAIAITRLDMQLGRMVKLDAVLGIGLPSQLNTLLGRQKTAAGQIARDADGHAIAAMDFFRTFKPQDPENSLVEMQLSISQAGITLTPETSFIQAIELQKDTNGNPVWHGDFGEYGAINVAVPQFSYKADSFATSGGFEVVRPLALPLTPIKQLMEAAKLAGAAQMLPDSLSLSQKINATNFVDAVTADLAQLVQKLGIASLTDEVTTILHAIANAFHKLPTSFTDYLNLQLPQSFNFNLSATPTGTIQFEASVKDGDPPIKLLIPGLMAGLPVLNGITLRSMSFGETAGGNLFLIKVDADIDQFDLATMALAVALPDNLPNNPLPPTQALQRRLRLEHLVMVMPVEFPIPVPLFYDNIGIEYLGLEGLLLQTHAQFPMPSPSFSTVGQVLANIKQFFSDRHFLLDPNTPPAGFSPRLFSLDNNFLQLPKYLGGSNLGKPGAGPALTYADIAHVLNGLKTLSVNELIQALPLPQRVGSAAVDFGPVSASLGWLVTTPDEFKKLAPAQKQLVNASLNLTTDDQAQSMLSTLPAAQPGQTPEQGMVVFLRGSAAVPNLARFDTVFGLAASNSLGFATGFHLHGDISNVISMDIAGGVKVNGKSNPAVSLVGSTKIALAGQTNPLFSGDVQITEQRFQCAGRLDVYGVGGAVNLIIDRTQGAAMHGALNPVSLTAGNLTVFKLNQATVDVTMRPNTMPTLAANAAVELLGMTSQTAIALSNEGFNFVTAGTLFNVFDAALQVSGTRLNSSANFRVKATMQSGGLAPVAPPAPAPISVETQRQIVALSQQSAQLQVQIAKLQTQIAQVPRLPGPFGGANIGNSQIAQLQAQLAMAQAQLAQVNQALAQLRVAPVVPATLPVASDFNHALKQEVSQAMKRAIDQSNAAFAEPQQKVTDAQREVDRLNGVVAEQRRIVNGERAGANQKLQSALDDVASKQREVDRLNGEIANRRAQIDQLSQDKSCLGSLCVIKPAATLKITKLGLEITGLGTELGTATAGLKTAQGTLDLARKLVVSTPVDADPRVFGPLGALKTAQGTLQLTISTLEGLKTASRGILQVSDYVAQRGLDALLLVKSASFETDINTAATGQVVMSIQLSYMDSPKSFSGGFNFLDATSSLKAMASAIAKQLLP